MLCTQSGTAFVVPFDEVGSGKKRYFSCYIQLVIAVCEILIFDILYCTLAMLSVLKGLHFTARKLTSILTSEITNDITKT